MTRVNLPRGKSSGVDKSLIKNGGDQELGEKTNSGESQKRLRMAFKKLKEGSAHRRIRNDRQRRDSTSVQAGTTEGGRAIDENQEGQC